MAHVCHIYVCACVSVRAMYVMQGSTVCSAMLTAHLMWFLVVIPPVWHEGMVYVCMSYICVCVRVYVCALARACM